MNQGLKPYPAYKDSDLLWAGEIPAHWEVRRGKVLFSCVDVRSKTGEEELLTVSSTRGVIPRRSATVTMFRAASYVGHKMCWPGDLVINSLWAWARGLGVSQLHGIVSSAYGVYRLRPESGILPEFIHQLTRSNVFQWELQVRSRGIWISRLQLTDEAFLAAPFLLPPPDEQAMIVRYLEHADGLIGRYIHAKQRLIALLNEQKQAVIQHAVTRGLDANMRLKPSGVEWLGDVPEHWEVVRLKNAAVVQTGLTLGKNYGNLVTQAYPYLRVANVQHGRVDIKHLKHVDVPPGEAARCALRAGDVLMTEGGDIDKLGRGCVWKDEIPACLHQNHIFAVRCNQDVLVPEFLVALMVSRHGRTYFQITAKQTTNLASTNSSTLRSFPLLLPPVMEQRHILERISNLTLDLDLAIADTDSEIALLCEYRTRLITDVVTGKVDVREAAARLPDVAEEPDDRDDYLVDNGAEEGADEVPDDADLVA